MTRASDPADVRLQANQTMAELRRFARLRIEQNDDALSLDWHALGYCYERAARMHPGAHRIERTKGGKHYQGAYICPAPTASAREALRKIVRFPPDWTVEAFAAGMAKAGRSKRKTFMAADAIAEMLGVRIVDRDALDLRRIGAIDLPKNEREKRRADRNREADRAYQEGKRRASGARPQAQSISRVKPWKIAGSSRTSFYSLTEKQRAEIMAAIAEGYSISADWTVSSSNISPKGINIPTDESVPASFGDAARGAAQAAKSMTSSAPLSDDALSLSLVGGLRRPESATIEQESPIMPASVPRLRLERRIREFGVSVDSPRVQSALDDFEVIAAMSAGAVHDALMSRENINHAAYLAIGDEPPLDIIAAFDARWSLVGLAA